MKGTIPLLPHPIWPPTNSGTRGWLSNSNYGFITKNEDRDIHPQLIRMLQEQREAFAEVGFDIDHLQSRVNI